MENVYIASTLSGQEFNAEASLSAKGVSVYLPRVMIDRRKPRDIRHNYRRFPMAVESAFGPYLFLFLQEGVDDFSTVRSDPFIIDFLRQMRYDGNYYPAPVDYAIVDALKARENEQGVYSTVYDYESGDKVRIRIGPFAGHEFVVKGSPEERINAVVNMFGKEIEIAFEYNQVEPA